MFIIRPILQTFSRLNFFYKINGPSPQITMNTKPTIRAENICTNIMDNRVPKECSGLNNTLNYDKPLLDAINDPYCPINIVIKNARIILSCKETIKLFATNLIDYYLHKDKNHQFPKLIFDSNINKNYNIETISCQIKDGQLYGKLIYNEDKSVDDIYVELSVSNGLLEGPINIIINENQLVGTFKTNMFNGIIFNNRKKCVFINNQILVQKN